MHALNTIVVTPIRKLQSYIASLVPFSICELLIALVIIWILWKIIRGKWKKLITGLIVLALFVWAGFSLMWGTYYYGTPAVETEKITTEQLSAVTEYFARMASDSYREEPDREDVLSKSAQMNGGIGAKGIHFSKIMSLIDFSGFFFPLTGEANVNMDMPAHDLAAACAHELAHLNGIPTEQEANFEAVRTSLEYGDADYVYSAALMAYTYLGNALYSADHDAWQKIAGSLSDNVKADLSETSAYWDSYKTKVKEVSNTVYENFLYSYDQDLGLKSYGACVDLLVNYYYETAIGSGTVQN